jgi:hypothetical protein
LHGIRTQWTDRHGGISPELVDRIFSIANKGKRAMNKSTLRLAAALWLIVGWMIPVANAAGVPAAVVTSPIYRFDPVIEGTEIEHAFVIRNNGTAPLEIIKVETG